MAWLQRGLYGSVRTVCDGYCYDPTLASESECLSECSPTYQNCWYVVAVACVCVCAVVRVRHAVMALTK